MTTQIRQQNGISILEPSGKIVGASILGLWETLSPQIEAHDTPRILINFEKVNKIDSLGLGALLDARAHDQAKEGAHRGYQCRKKHKKHTRYDPNRN